jgi:hypothetical protein
MQNKVTIFAIPSMSPIASQSKSLLSGLLKSPSASLSNSPSASSSGSSSTGLSATPSKSPSSGHQNLYQPHKQQSLCQSQWFGIDGSQRITVKVSIFRPDHDSIQKGEIEEYTSSATEKSIFSNISFFIPNPRISISHIIDSPSSSPSGSALMGPSVSPSKSQSFGPINTVHKKVKLKNIPQLSPNIVYFSEIKKIFCES